MSQFILDTDHISLWLQGHPLISQMAAAQRSEVGATVVTVQELFNGWVSRLNDPKRVNEQVNLYTRLWTTVDLLRQVTILNFDIAAEAQYHQLVRENPALRKNRIQKDMKIAATVLAIEGVLVTRNYKDFSQVPGLKLENWADSDRLF
jgi:tRNA(fMet)-specific endonuclease VapC